METLLDRAFYFAAGAVVAALASQWYLNRWWRRVIRRLVETQNAAHNLSVLAVLKAQGVNEEKLRELARDVTEKGGILIAPPPRRTDEPHRN